MKPFNAKYIPKKVMRLAKFQLGDRLFVFNPPRFWLRYGIVTDILWKDGKFSYYLEHHLRWYEESDLAEGGVA